MAYATDFEDDDNSEQQIQQRLAQTPQQPSTGTSAAGGLFGNAPSGGAETSGQSGAVKSNSSNSGWTNLDSYLNANQDQAAGMGSTIAGNVNQKASQANSDINALNSNWNNSVNSQTVNADPNAIQQAMTDATNGNPANNSNWNTDVSNFQRQAQAQYGGPTDFTQQSGYGSASGEARNADTAVGELGSDAGRENLLNDEYQNTSPNGYSQGEKSLDDLLVAGNPSASKAMSDVTTKWNTEPLSTQLGSDADTGNAAAKNAIGTDSATARAAQSALGSFNANGQGTGTGELGNWAKGISDQTVAAQKAYTDANSGIASDITNGALTAADYKALGLTPDTQIYGMSPQQIAGYLQTGTAPTTANTASADEYAEAQALQQLIDAGGNPGATGVNPLNPADSAQASSAGNPYAFNNSGFNAGVVSAKASANDAINNFINTKFYPALYQGAAPSNGQSGEPLLTADNFLTQFPTLYNQAMAQAQATAPGTNNWSGATKVANLQALVPAWNQLNDMLKSSIGNYSGNAPTNLSGTTGGQMRPTSLAFGGSVLPSIPKMPSLKFPMHNIDVAKQSLRNVARQGTPSEQAVVGRQARAHYPQLFAGGGEAQGNTETLGRAIGYPGSGSKESSDASPSAWAKLLALVGNGSDADAKAKSFKAGGPVPGKAKVPGDSYKNDTVKAMLSPGEEVIDRETLADSGPVGVAARSIAKYVNSKKKQKV